MKEINDWYEEEGFNSGITKLEDKMSILRNNFEQIDERKNIENRRNLAIEKYQKELKETYEEGKRILNKKLWVEEHYNKTFLKEISALEDWFSENSAKQSKLKLYDVKR